MVFNFNDSPAPARTVTGSETAVPPSGAVPLCELRPGCVAVVQCVDTSCPVGRRLQDLGFVPGTEVTLVRRAPLGDPSEYELRGARLCLRRREAARVGVRPR
jgi:Fe2+ transport system protein FeoA